MRRTVLVVLFLLQFVATSAQEKEWTWRDSQDNERTTDELVTILQEHKKWDESEAKEGERADLSGAFLRDATLIGVNLRDAKLSRANLRDATLIGANLSRADLFRADLFRADLTRANLSGANLIGATLIGAHLKDAKLSRATLSLAKLSRANLFRADLSGASLSRANLTDANLRDATLTDANLRDAKLSRANLRDATLIGANLSRADFSETDLTSADLEGAVLRGTKLATATVGENTNFANSLFEPVSLPFVGSMIFANWSDLRYTQRASVVALREEFKKAGFRDAERQLTFMLNQIKERRSIESVFRYIFFELTCQWGMWPGLCLWILLGLLGVFSVPYMFALSLNSKIFGIWRVWSEERILTQFGSEEPERLKPAARHIPFWALYFSILSAFHFGWKDLNVGSWLARIQRREYTLRATGWVRVVSGLQSITSVYLLALWALTYFGRPFE